MLLNSKKLHIRQLVENRSKVSGNNVNDKTSSITHSECTSSVVEAPDESQNSDGCYDSDTDVDEPSMMMDQEDDLDTDEEKEIRLSPIKTNKRRLHGSQSNSNASAINRGQYVTPIRTQRSVGIHANEKYIQQGSMFVSNGSSTPVQIYRTVTGPTSSSNTQILRQTVVQTSTATSVTTTLY